MHIFFKRPLMTACMLFLLSSVAGYFLNPFGSYKLWLVVAAVLVALLTFFLWLFQKASSYTALSVIMSSIMIAASLLSSYSYFNVKAASYEELYDKDHTVEATVISTKSRDANYVEYLIKVENINGEHKPHIAVLTCEYGSVAEEGFSFTASVHAIGFDDLSDSQRLSMQADGIFVRYVSESESSFLITNENTQNIHITFANINRSFSDIYSKYLDEETAGMCSALFLGNKDALANTVRRDFSRAGVSHILALSGMHMSIIMGILMLILKYSGVDHKIIAALLTVCAILYLFISGFQVSAARAVIMLLLVYLSILLFSTPDPLTSLGVAGALIMMLIPGTVIDASFWLSFSATLGILVFSPFFNDFTDKLLSPLKKKRLLFKPLKAIMNVFAVSIFALMPLIAVMCIFIKSFSIYTALSSAVLSLPSAAAIFSSMMLLLFHRVPVISSILTAILQRLTEFMTDYCAEISKKEGIVVSLNYPFATLAAIVIGCCLLFAFTVKFKRPILTLIPFVLSILVFICGMRYYNYSDKDNLSVRYYNASSKSDMIVLSNNGEAIICDIGNGSNSSYYSVMAAVRESRATEIRAVVLTRYYYAQSATLNNLFSNNSVRELWLSKPLTEDEYHKMVPLVALAEKHGVKAYVYGDGQELAAFESVRIKVHKHMIKRSQVPITVINIKGEKESVLYCSSGIGEWEDPTIENYLAEAEYIIFGNVGPVIKAEYSLPDEHDADAVIFADKLHAAYFDSSNTSLVAFILSEKECLINIQE